VPAISVVRRSLVAALAVVVCLPGVGTVVALDPDDSDKPFIWPTRGRLTQNYGCSGFWAEPRRGSCAHFHSGLDIANARGTPIRAVADGVIELVGWDPWLRPDPAWMVIIDHGGGLRTMYAHMRAKRIDGIREGARVEQGQLIGLMDSTGRSTGPHLHFAVYRNGQAVNPRPYLAGQLERRTPRRDTDANGCAMPPSYGGVGAWLGGTTAMLPEPDTTRSTCAA
jgi:murein DD-endopeptidase MepM/ murein hydrolase activator NlpD